MKYLQDYLSEKQSALLKKYGVFFAFSEKQWNEGVNPELTKADYSAVMGGYCPTKNAAEFIVEHAKVVQAAVAEDVAENGLQAIIIRELNNHECYCTGDIYDAVEALKLYNVPAEEVNKVFNNQKHTPEVLDNL